MCTCYMCIYISYTILPVTLAIYVYCYYPRNVAAPRRTAACAFATCSACSSAPGIAFIATAVQAVRHVIRTRCDLEAKSSVR